MNPRLLALALLVAVCCISPAVVVAVQDEPPLDEQEEHGQEQQQQRPRAKMAPEAQRITLEYVSGECYDSVFSVLNGDAEQSSLSEDCLKQMTEGYNKSPLGELQQRELVATQTAAVLRVSMNCREELRKSSQQPQEGEEASQPSESCIEDFQKHFRDMQQWTSMATLSKLTEECKKEAQAGSLGVECEQEFVLMKPSILQTLEGQNEQKLKEPPKEEKKKRNTTGEARPRKEKPAPPLVDPSLIFLIVWSSIIGGTIVYTCFWYYKTPAAQKTAVMSAPEQAPVHKSKTQQKKEARQQRVVQRGRN